jgi:beta-glucosidase
MNGKNMHSLKSLVLAYLAIFPSQAYDLARRRNAANATYKDPTASIDDRVSDLLSRMTIAEKAAQLIQGDISNWINTTTNTFNHSGLVWNFDQRGGQFYVGYPIVQSWISEGIKKAQDYIAANTTLGIPALAQTEGIHGLLVENATVFNSPIAHACSWDPKLVEEMAGLIAQEALALGINQLFAPVVDLARELRFGRVEETYGEDPFLAGEFGYSYVKGVQSWNVSATVKHFAGFSAPEQGLNTGPVHGGPRELRTTWLPSFKRAIVDAGAWSIMNAYHSYDGIPAVADHRLLTDILRNQWRYKYWVTSDAGATDRLCCAFKMCRCTPVDSQAIVLNALPAGTDVEMGGGSYNYKLIPQLVEEGKLDIEAIDTAVARQLRAKFEMGLFEHPYQGVPQNKTKELIHTPNAIELARRLDAESIVLLENHNNTLPLRRDAAIAVIGPMADFVNVSSPSSDAVLKTNFLSTVTMSFLVHNTTNTASRPSRAFETRPQEQCGMPKAANDGPRTSLGFLKLLPLPKRPTSRL